MYKALSPQEQAKWLAKHTDPTRTALAQPWQLGNYDLATDGCVLTAVRNERPTPPPMAHIMATMVNACVHVTVDTAELVKRVGMLRDTYHVDTKNSRDYAVLCIDGAIVGLALDKLHLALTGADSMETTISYYGPGAPVTITWDHTWCAIMPVQITPDLTPNEPDVVARNIDTHNANMMAHYAYNVSQRAPGGSERLTMIYHATDESTSRVHMPCYITDTAPWQPDLTTPAVAAVDTSALELKRTTSDAADIARQQEMGNLRAENRKLARDLDTYKTQAGELATRLTAVTQRHDTTATALETALKTIETLKAAPAPSPTESAQGTPTNPQTAVEPAHIPGPAPLAHVDTTPTTGRWYIAWGNAQIETPETDTWPAQLGYTYAKRFSRWYGILTDDKRALLTARYGAPILNPYTKRS